VSLQILEMGQAERGAVVFAQIEPVIARVNVNLSELDNQIGGAKIVQSASRVEGGWNAVIRVPAIRSDEELAVELLTAEGCRRIRATSMTSRLRDT
jgi:hypothetical protein